MEGFAGHGAMRALIIGYGSAGKTHAAAYKAAGGDIVIAGPHAGGATGGGDWNRLLPEVDIVSICSPDEFHFLQAVEALKAGKHVIVEKPPCIRLDELKFLMEWTAKHPE